MAITICSRGDAYDEAQGHSGLQSPRPILYLSFVSPLVAVTTNRLVSCTCHARTECTKPADLIVPITLGDETQARPTTLTA
ncbi:unnamed protein product [Protopolystoma xenopodis]|uniref:Uncharacterized protein n=1 Tax=Protopolystoma xenopodis TaxID=117903 RepID=A0A3S5AGA8_9PLAT|nr:unnamed protein product [Protopolystoma xenopodis]